MTESAVKMRDGARLVYELHGEAGKPRIALIHSLAMDRHFWRRMLPLVTPHASVLVYDCRGHGQSDKTPGPYSVAQFADDLAGLMDHVGWTSAVVAGASMGGCITLAFGEKHGARADGLGLIDTTAAYNAPAAWEERAAKASTEGLSALTDFQVTRWFTDGFREANRAIVDASVKTFVANDVAAYAATCRMLGAADLVAALPKMTMPCAIVVGDEDYATPIAMAQTMKDSLPDATMTVLKDARHLTPLETPERVAAALTPLLQPAAVS